MKRAWYEKGVEWRLDDGMMGFSPVARLPLDDALSASRNTEEKKKHTLSSSCVLLCLLEVKRRSSSHPFLSWELSFIARLLLAIECENGLRTKSWRALLSCCFSSFLFCFFNAIALCDGQTEHGKKKETVTDAVILLVPIKQASKQTNTHTRKKKNSKEVQVREGYLCGYKELNEDGGTKVRQKLCSLVTEAAPRPHPPSFFKPSITRPMPLSSLWAIRARTSSPPPTGPWLSGCRPRRALPFRPFYPSQDPRREWK